MQIRSQIEQFWPWIAGAVGLLGAVIALLLWRRRTRKEPEIAFEQPVVKPPAPARPVAAVTESTVPDPVFAPGLAIALEARRMSASLVATSLSYRLIVTNHSGMPVSALAVEGDMVSAHASLPPEQQIAQVDQRLELCHALVELAPGESVEFSGDFRLSLAAITPIRAGEAAYFVPLARFRVEAGNSTGQSLTLAQTFVIGELPEAAGAALRPFRLDLGPRIYTKVGQQPVN